MVATSASVIAPAVQTRAHTPQAAQFSASTTAMSRVGCFGGGDDNGPVAFGFGADKTGVTPCAIPHRLLPHGPRPQPIP